MTAARNLFTALAIAATLGCASSTPAAPKPVPADPKHAPQMLSTVKPEDIEAARPGGKLPGDVKAQLVKVAGDFLDPIHLASPKDGTGRLFVCERPGRIKIIKNGKGL